MPRPQEKIDAFSAIAAVHHQGEVHAIEIAPVQKFHFAAQIVDHAFFPQFFAEGQLDHFFRGHGHQPDAAAKAIKRAWRLERGGHAQQSGSLGVVPAAMRHAVYGFGMVCDIQRVQLA